MNRHRGYLHPFACFRCRRSFKRCFAGDNERPCPHCGGVAVRLNRKFKAPRRADREQWAKVEYLVRHGYRFQSLPQVDGRPVAYPATLRAAEVFVSRYGRLAAQPRNT